jgi:glyoxylase-like metal-dependent hydrolase (beta-lactamase superfamily II)
MIVKGPVQPPPGVARPMGDGVTCILAPNPSAMTGWGTNTYILGAGKTVAVIDPGPAMPAHLSAILAATGARRISHILVTHPHADHSGLAGDLAAATEAPTYGFGPAGSGRSALMRRLAAHADLGGGEGSDDRFVPDIRLTDGAVLNGEGWALTALHCPGHMAEHLCLALGDLLFSGDLVMGWSTSLISPPDGDMGDYMASLDKLARHPWSRFLPGHGDPIDAPALRLADLAAHRRAREATIITALSDIPQTLAVLTARAYADTPVALHAAASRNAHAHLIDLAVKGRVLATPDLTPGALFRLR